MSSEPGTPLMDAVCRGSVADVRRCMQQFRENIPSWVDSPDPSMLVTPLMMCAFRTENDGVLIATALVDAGAGVNTPDGTPAKVGPLFMAAQQGNAALVLFLLERGAILTATGRGSTTTAVWIASQNGHAQCVARLLENAERRGVGMVDTANNQGKTAALIAVELAHPECLGVLARCGADLRRASPPFYGIMDAAAGRVSHFDPTPSSSVHAALDAAARSFGSKKCCVCGAAARQSICEADRA